MDARQERYLRVKTIVLAAEGLPEDARMAYVDAQCDGDGALRDDVLSLLAGLSEGRDLPPPDWSALASPDLSGARLDAASGSGYRIRGRLGQGGMGVVYLAERMLGGSMQQVALKMLDGGLQAARGARERFGREADILASLSHANIARLLDTGKTREGVPFLAMEYVEGRPIDQWCDERGLPLEARISLVLKVCAAVDYAHRHLVIHRDIKPANILVDAEGEPKLLDFGIARLLEENGLAAGTQTGLRALTLAYASPEQIRNEPLGTASDVWQLGVLLYELVSGARPFPRTGSPLALTHAILTGAVTAPSRAVQRADPSVPARARRRVPADIDAIVLKAMRTAPAERYAGVAELAADLRRFLESRPVRARRGQWWYHARRFVARHRAGVAVAGLALALLVAFAFAREGQLRRTQLERDKAEAMAGFMSELFEKANPSQTGGNRITVAEALDQGAERLLARTDLDREVRAAMLLSIGRGYNALDMGHRAIPLLRQAADLLPEIEATAQQRGETMAALGRAYSMALDMPATLEAGRRALELLQRPGVDNGDLVMRVRINMLYAHLSVRDLPLAEIVAQLQDIAAALDARADPDMELQVLALAALSMAQLSAGDDAQAGAHAQRALRIARGLYGPNDPALVYYRFVAALSKIRGDPAQAIAEYRELSGDYARMTGAPTPGLGGILAYFGWALDAYGRHEDAAQAMERAERIAREFAGTAPDFHSLVLASLASQYRELGRDQEALALLQGHERVLRTRVGSGLAWAVRSRVEALNIEGAIALDRRSLPQAREAYGQAGTLADAHPHLVGAALRADTLVGLARTDLAEGRASQALALIERYRQVDAGTDAATAARQALLAPALRARGLLLEGRTEESLAALEAAVALASARPQACIALRRTGRAVVEESRRALQQALAPDARERLGVVCDPAAIAAGDRGG